MRSCDTFCLKTKQAITSYWVWSNRCCLADTHLGLIQTEVQETSFMIVLAVLLYPGAVAYIFLSPLLQV